VSSQAVVDVKDRPPADVRRLLRAVLDAQLTPTLTVEQACHLDVDYMEDDELPALETIFADVGALHNAGLATSRNCVDRYTNQPVPDAIMLVSPKRFKKKFPELASAIPVMLAHEGVQPYTDGIPRLPRMLDVVK
jgi:hypothetical protein